jgi:regulatory protein
MTLDAKFIDRALDKAALRYLERFDSSLRILRRLLQRKAASLLAQGADQALVTERIDDLLLRYQKSGLLDDARYAAVAVRNFRERGLGQRSIVQRLKAKGVDSAAIDQGLASVDRDCEDAELQAARRYVKRRRLGPYRGGQANSSSLRKDLQALARAGFNYEVARQALGAECLEDDVF